MTMFKQELACGDCGCLFVPNGRCLTTPHTAFCEECVHGDGDGDGDDGDSEIQRCDMTGEPFWTCECAVCVEERKVCRAEDDYGEDVYVASDEWWASERTG